MHITLRANISRYHLSSVHPHLRDGHTHHGYNHRAINRLSYSTSVDYSKISYKQNNSLVTTDIFGNPIYSTKSEECINFLNEFHDNFTGYGKKVTSIYKAAAADQNCVVANAIAASVDFFIGDSKAKERGHKHLLFAENASNNQLTSDWELLWLSIAKSYSTGDLDAAIRKHLLMSEKHSSDLSSSLFGQIQCFYSGKLQEHLDIVRNIFDIHKLNGNIYGPLAFAYEQVGDLQTAEKLANEGLNLIAHHPWIHHCIAHLMDSQNRVNDAISFLESKVDDWPHYIRWAEVHNCWHLNLNYLAKKDYDKVLNFYDHKIFPNDKKYRSDRNVQIDAIALLWRLDFETSFDPILQKRWEDIYEYTKNEENTLMFADIHRFYSIARVNLEHAQQLFASYEKINSNDSRYQTLFLPFADSIIQYFKNDTKTAFSKIQTISSFLPFGGSIPQRRLFENYYSHLKNLDAK